MFLLNSILLTAQPAKSGIPTALIVTIIILAVLIAVIVVLVILGRKMQKRQEESQVQMEANKQTVTALIIDKKRVRAKDAQLSPVILDSIPKLMRHAKMPIVKAKIGPQIMNLISDEKIYAQIPLKKEVKLTVSGIYITGVKGVRGSLPPGEGKKRSKFSKWVEKLQEKAGAKPIK